MIAETLSRALCSQKSNNNGALSGLFFEVGAADLCLKIKGKKEAHSTRIPRRRLRFTQPWRSRWPRRTSAGSCPRRGRVTADDIRQRYSAPVSGILAPQRVSNLRIVTKL
jgi:hypothetical protein